MSSEKNLINNNPLQHIQNSNKINTLDENDERKRRKISFLMGFSLGIVLFLTWTLALSSL